MFRFGSKLVRQAVCCHRSVSGLFGRSVAWRSGLRIFFLLISLVLLILVIGDHLHPVTAMVLLIVLLAVAMTVTLQGSAEPSMVARTERRPDPFAAARSLAAVLPDPCFLLSLDGKVLFQNRYAREIFGQDMEGRPVGVFLRAPEIIDSMHEVVRTERSAFFEYVTHWPIDRCFGVYITPWRGGERDMAVDGLVMILRDRTEQQRAERMRVDFVANASHELRTPLDSLIGFIETLQDSTRDDPDTRGRFLGIMRGQAWRMSRLIDDLLSLGRIESNAHVRPVNDVNLVEIVHHVTEELRPLAVEAGKTLELNLATQPLFVCGEEKELVQLVQNLIENAIKYSDGGKTIWISVCLEPDTEGRGRICLSVRDEGPGIAPEHVPRLTERFYRVDIASSREKGGTGLGLAIVKHIVNRHRGSLRIDSAPGGGALFEIHLDRVDH